MYREADAGEYRCKAESTFQNPGHGAITAAALSPIITLHLVELRAGPFRDEPYKFTGDQYSAFKIPCEPIAVASAEIVLMKWYISNQASNRMVDLAKYENW